MIQRAFSGTSEAFDRRKGRGLREGRGRREEDGRRAGEKRPSEVAVRDDERRGRSCPENYWFGGGVEAINSYI